MSLHSAIRRRLLLVAGLALTVPRRAFASPPAAVIHRLQVGAPGDPVFWDLPEGVAVLPASIAAPAALRDAFLAARALAGEPHFARGLGLNAVSLGPVLDGPDHVGLRELSVAHDPLLLHIAYTRVRHSGAELRRNVSWRPLLAVALPATALAPGPHELRAAWQEVDTGNESSLQTCHFVIDR